MSARDENLPHREPRTRRVIIPARRTAPSPVPTKQIVVPPSPQPEPSTHPKDLARVRENLGFDDIPIDALDSRSMRDVLDSWATQAFHLNHPDNRAGKVYRFFRNKQFRAWKEDLKWALQADMHDDHGAKKSVAPPAPVQPPVHRSAAHHVIQPTQLAPSHASATKSVEININFGSMPKLPTLRKPTAIAGIIAKIRGFSWTRRRVIIAAAAVAIIIGSGAALRFIPGMSGAPKKNSAVSSTSINQAPEYATILPDGKSVDSLGGWHRVSPPGKEAVFAYVDKIGDVQINVSQQPLPASFKPNVDDKIAELAKSYAATDKVSADSLTMYIGTSAHGPQSAIMVKDDLLILIKSTQKIDDKDWASYAQSLK